MPTQTPAARKFLPPSSSSGRQRAFSTRFAPPTQTSSSPFPRTPFSSNAQHAGRDDIEIDESDSDGQNLGATLTQAPKVSTHHNRSSPAADAIIDQPYVSHGPTSPGSKRRKISHFKPDAAATRRSHMLDSSPPSSPSRPAEREAAQIDNDQLGHEDNVEVQIPHSSPLLGSTRTRAADTSHATLERDQAIALDNDNQHNHPSSSPAPSPPTRSNTVQTPRHRTSRFRQAQGLQDSNLTQTTAPFPSFQSRLLGDNTSGPNLLRGPHPVLDYTLPDAFSPSRRRGKGQAEYVYGGHAETVRGWILDVAARTGSGNTTVASLPRQDTDEDRGLDISTGTGTSVGDTGRIIVQTVLVRDLSARFIVVQATTAAATTQKDEGSTWMLINTDAQSQVSSSISANKLERLQIGSKITLKGGRGTSWPISTDWLLNTTDQHWNVAVLWDVVT